MAALDRIDRVTGEQGEGEEPQTSMTSSGMARIVST